MPDQVERSEPVWHILMHVLHHSAQHRAEAAAMLTHFNLSPGNIDYIGFEWYS